MIKMQSFLSCNVGLLELIILIFFAFELHIYYYFYKNFLDKKDTTVFLNVQYSVKSLQPEEFSKLTFEKNFLRNFTKRNFWHEVFAKILLGLNLPRV
jgi:hypothetical protein